MTTECQQYEPGRININPHEARLRRETAILSLLFGLITFAFLILVDAQPWVYVFLLPSVWMAAIGFLQASTLFCIRFGLQGKQNANDFNSPIMAVVSKEAQRKDKRQAQYLILSAAIIAVVVTSLASLFAQNML